MDINSLPNWIAQEFEFPLTNKTVIDRAGGSRSMRRIV